jgi:hypothetical protein
MSVVFWKYLFRMMGGKDYNLAGSYCSFPKPQIRRNTRTIIGMRHGFLSLTFVIIAHILHISSSPAIYSLLSTTATITTSTLCWLVKVRAEPITSSRLQRCSFVDRYLTALCQLKGYLFSNQTVG